MFLKGNFRIHCLEWDYPVDNSKFACLSPMDKFCIGVLSGKYFIWYVKCGRLYITIIIFFRAMQCQSGNMWHENKVHS